MEWSGQKTSHMVLRITWCHGIRLTGWQGALSRSLRLLTMLLCFWGDTVCLYLAWVWICLQAWQTHQGLDATQRMTCDEGPFSACFHVLYVPVYGLPQLPSPDTPTICGNPAEIEGLPWQPEPVSHFSPYVKIPQTPTLPPSTPLPYIISQLWLLTHPIISVMFP